MVAQRNTRRYPRIHCDLPMFVEQLSDGEYQGFSRTRILGEGGCMFLSPRRVGYLSLLKLSISVGGRIVTADARVVYERACAEREVQVGIEFLRLAPADRAHLRTLCTSPGAGEA